MSSTFDAALIAVSCVSTFFFCKIFVGNYQARGKSRKLSPEDREAFNIKYRPVKQKDDEEVGGGNGGGGDDAAPTEVDALNGAERFTRRDRWKNLGNNDKENIPYAMFIFWGLIIVGFVGGDSIDWVNSVTLYTSILYTICRLLYTVFYLYGCNSRPVPLRSLVYGLAQLIAAIAAISLPIAAILSAVN